ncbi:hypothetical protein ACIPSE_45070 [Streptomyces sp. NPDC090106]
MGLGLLAVGALVWSSGVARESAAFKVSGLLFVLMSTPLLFGLL